MSDNKLKKQLGLYDVFAICTGAMFSSGFFLLPGIAAAQTGESVYLAYLASGILIIPAMLSVAELSTAMPKSGGTYYFLDRSLGPMVGTIGGLGSWVALMFKSSFALIGMGAYLALFVDVSFTMLALILTLIFGFLNIFGAKETTLLQRILVTVLVLIMGLFIIQGVSAAGLDISISDSENGFFSNNLHGFISTIGLVFVSYAGLTKVTSVAEEVKNPDRNIPLGMILSLTTASLIYVAGVYIMQQVLTAEEFYSSLTPVADAGAKFMNWLPGSGGMLLIVVAAVAAFASTGNAGIMSASRYPFAMSRDKLMSPKFSDIGKQGTPYYAIIVTVICMILILLIFDVESVAKLASAFQLLLFGFMCLAVIVMRESNINSYRPGFKSPLYPWVQIAGMLISVWLVAEMGILAVSLTGFIVVMCVAWYIYYTKGRINRRGAIFHVHERLGKKRYDDLELELLNILSEKNTGEHLSYKETIARSIIVDVDSENTKVDELLREASKILYGRLKVEKKMLLNELTENYNHRFNKLSSGVICSYHAMAEVSAPELVVFRIKKSLDLEITGVDGNVYMYAILLVPEEEEGLDIRLVGHLAEIVQSSGFKKRWMQSGNKRELRECLLSEGHFIQLKVNESKQLMEFAGKKIRDINLPGSSLITIIYRGSELIIPHGNTLINEEDEFLMVGDPDDIKELMSS
ncbi:MAG: amino acid permease [Gracilimonas sp.]|uniref:amino acid permease n=1 Tax=Gracilimonas TaxID=649462 RepID=UPI001B18C494|nr:amino acid permease [Gracilimonas sp.]MBO6585876.1 amino acid permease [Gracilimonas sp.]MBO6616873.1 amino acid permease [Gracilimonas sp.]